MFRKQDKARSNWKKRLCILIAFVILVFIIADDSVVVSQASLVNCDSIEGQWKYEEGLIITIAGSTGVISYLPSDIDIDEEYPFQVGDVVLRNIKKVENRRWTVEEKSWFGNWSQSTYILSDGGRSIMSGVGDRLERVGECMDSQVGTIGLPAILSDGDSSEIIPGNIKSSSVGQAVAAAGVAATVSLATLLMTIAQKPITGTGAPPVISGGPPVNDQGQVFYQPPWDEGGAYWMNGDEYRRMREMMDKGMVWSNAYGWIERQDLSERQTSWQESLDAAADEARVRKAEQDMLIEQRRLENEYEQARLDYIHELRNKVSDSEHQAFMDQRAIQFSYQEGIRGTAREIFTGVGQKWDPESGQYIDSLSYSSMGLRILTGVATGGTSEYIYKPVWSAYSVNDRLERGETLFDAIMGTGDALAKQYAGGQVLKAASPYISYGMNKATGYIPDSVKSAGSAIKNTLTKPRSLPFGSKAARLSPVTKPVPLAPELAPTKRAVSDALRIKDPIKQAEAIKRLYSNNGMNKLRALEQSGHLTAEQANQINQAMTREVNKAVNDATTRNLNSFRVSEKIATKNGMVVKDVYKVEGVKVEQVMIGDSGSSSAVKIFKNKGRSIYTDHDRTVHVTFNKEQLQAYADAKYMSPKEAQIQLNKVFTENQKGSVIKSLNRSGLNSNDVDVKIYSGLGGKAGQADSYPGGFTSVRQATQGRTEVFKINSQAQVSSYKTSGQALTDQAAIDRFNYSGKDNWLQSGGPKIANANRYAEGKDLLGHQINGLKSGDIQQAAKASERLDKGLVLMDSPYRVPPATLRLANYIRNNPQHAFSIPIDQKQAFLREVSKLAEQAGELL